MTRQPEHNTYNTHCKKNMSTTNKEGQAGLAPELLITLSEFTQKVFAMGDDEIDSQIEVFEDSKHTGKWGRDRVEILKNERSRRWRSRRGEGRVA